MVTVYTKPKCVACNATKKTLDKLGVAYAMVDVSEDVTAEQHARALGYSSLPVVVAGNQHWSGFRPDRLKALAV